MRIRPTRLLAAALIAIGCSVSVACEPDTISGSDGLTDVLRRYKGDV